MHPAFCPSPSVRSPAAPTIRDTRPSGRTTKCFEVSELSKHLRLCRLLHHRTSASAVLRVHHPPKSPRLPLTQWGSATPHTPSLPECPTTVSEATGSPPISTHAPCATHTPASHLLRQVTPPTSGQTTRKHAYNHYTCKTTCSSNKDLHPPVNPHRHRATSIQQTQRMPSLIHARVILSLLFCPAISARTPCDCVRPNGASGPATQRGPGNRLEALPPRARHFIPLPHTHQKH